MTPSVSNTAYQKRRLRGEGEGVNRNVHLKDKHCSLSRRLHNGKAAVFTRVEAKRKGSGSEQEMEETKMKDVLFLRTLYAH
jgi:hypothetical protein